MQRLNDCEIMWAIVKNNRMILHMKNLTALITVFLMITAPAHAADLAKGKAVYDEECESCHGANGAPNATLEKKLKLKMKDLRDATVLAKANAEWNKMIVAGVGKMKPVKGLSATAVDDVIAYSRSLKK